MPPRNLFERTIIVTARADGRDALAQAIDEEARRRCLECHADTFCRPDYIQVLDYPEGIQNIKGVV